MPSYVRGRRQAGPAPSRSWATAKAATWAREWKPSLLRMLATCRSAVAGEIDSSAAI